MAPSSYWTPERLVWLRRAIVDESLTATQAAIRYFPEKSRNAIIGAVHRHLKGEGITFARPPLGPLKKGNHDWRLAKLAGETYVNKPKPKRVRKPKPVAVEAPPIIPPEPAPPPPPPPPPGGAITVFGIREGLCRFPLWDSRLTTREIDIEDRLYCGCATHRGLVYCDKHHRQCNTGSIYVRRAKVDGDYQGEGEAARTRPVKKPHRLVRG